MDSPSKSQPPSVPDERFLGESMFRRITNFGADKNSSQTKHWMPDSAGKECYNCQEKFTPFRRRHHCRNCGLLFCSRCCSYEPQAKLAGFSESNIRLCAYCSATLLKLAKSSALPATTASAATATNSSYLSSAAASSIDAQQQQIHLSRSQLLPIDSTPSDNSFNPDHFSLSKTSSVINVDPDQTANDDESSMTSTDGQIKPMSTSSSTSSLSQNRSNNSFNLKALFNELFRTPQGLQMQKQRYRFRVIDCITGKEIVDWLLKHQRASVLSEAKLLCQCFINETYLEPVVLPGTPFVEFKSDQTWYKFGKKGLEKDLGLVESGLFRSGSIVSTDSTDSLPQNMSKSTGVMIGTDLTSVQFNSQTAANAVQDETVSISSRRDASDFNMPIDGSEQVDDADDLPSNNKISSSPSDAISALYDEYEELLLKQILIQFHVDHDWFSIILNVCRRLTQMIPVSSITHDSTTNNDIRRNVKFKKLPGGSKSETEIITGCVFTKNVVDRAMPSKIDGPRVLLLKAQIEYQRSDDHRLTTLEPVLNQEAHYLSSVVEKINSHFRPNILVVEKSVSRLAQESIKKSGIVLIYNVKENIMSRLAKCLTTTIMTSIDSRLPSHVRPPLGFCDKFQVKEYQLNDGVKKRLMFFEGCPPENGCSVLIRGGTLTQLKVVKSIMRLFLLITYSTQLERAFLNDCYAQIMNNHTSEFATIRQFDLENYIDQVVSDKQAIIDLITKGLLLSTSPLVHYNPPYILRCDYQQYLPSELLYQSIYNQKYQQRRETNTSSIDDDKTNKDTSTLAWFYHSPYNQDMMHVNDKHAFMKDHTLLPGVHPETKSVYAHFRAAGGRCSYRRRRWYDWLMLQQQQQPRDQPLETILAPYLDLRLHLHIAILYSAHCTVQSKLLTCRQPEILEMPAYSIQDTTLGSFLEQHCFSTNDAPCKTCQQPLQDHVRQIVHGDMKLVIRIKHIDKTTTNLKKAPVTNGIFMWSYCEHCRESSAKRPMSSRTWSLSFTKFLELLFHLESFGVFSTRACQHHLFRDHYHYFHSRQFIASFRLFKIKLKEFILPTSSVILKPFVHERDYYIELTKSLSVNGYNIFSTIVERLVELKNLNSLPEYFIAKIDQYLTQERLEQQTFRSLMDEIQLKMTAGNGAEERRQLDALSYLSIDDQIVEAKKFISKIVQNWNIILLELDQFVKKHEKQQREASKKVNIKAIPSGDSNTETMNSLQNESEASTTIPDSGPPPLMPLVSVEGDESITVENGIKTTVNTSTNDDDAARRSGVLKFFSNLLPNAENDFTGIKSPFSEDEHLQLSGKYIVNHKELSSIIAHALSMSEYEHRLNEELALVNNESNTDEKKIEVKMTDGENENAIDDHQHVELQFFDSSTKFTVKIFYAAKFHQLRQVIFANQDETSYIRSLSRCKRWQPRGGKSKSEFWQTFDDYFVLKDLNQKESLSFSTFAPSYIDYISNALKYNRPTSLTKIFGVYHIQYRHNVSGENFKRDILVLENLLNNPHMSSIPPAIYDLKGSMRNRLAAVDEGQTNAVFLDENFLTHTQENPFYVRLHTKWTLMKALHADSQFLAKHGIVDYSLLVSCHTDDQKSIVYAGIIDYIRTYTWDKKIETIVKSMGGQGQSPTVISPENYRVRFLKQMDQYFPVVPDEWHAYEKRYLDLRSFQTETMANNFMANNELPTQ